VLNNNIRATLKKIGFPTVSSQGGLITNKYLGDAKTGNVGAR
jgi:hypothetical protein